MGRCDRRSRLTALKLASWLENEFPTLTYQHLVVDNGLVKFDIPGHDP